MSDNRFDEIFPDPSQPSKKKRTLKKDLETAVVRECLVFLAACEQVVYAERRNTGAVQFEDGGFIRFGSKGAADIWCLVIAYGVSVAGRPVSNHHHVEIECKRRSGGRLSSDQKKFQQFCAYGCIPYLVVTSAVDLAEQLQKAGLLP